MVTEISYIKYLLWSAEGVLYNLCFTCFTVYFFGRKNLFLTILGNHGILHSVTVLGEDLSNS